MAHSSIELSHLTLRLPSGRVLLDGVSHTFSSGLTGIVGANGAGKSMLLRCIADLLAPDAGSVASAGRLHYVAQQQDVAHGATLADLAGLGELLAASARLEAGNATEADFELLDGRWTALSDFSASLQACGLGQPDLAPGDSAAHLSGGERTRVALAGAFHSGADWLLLDEPSNHLDRAGRTWLLDSLRAWRGNALIVSHDRELLDIAHNIVAIESRALRSYGGNYTLYRAQRNAEEQAAAAALDHARNERDKSLREQRARHDAMQARTARQNRAGKDANMPAIVRGNLKSGAQAYAGREAAQRAESREALDEAVRSAAARATSAPAVALLMPGTAVPASRRVLELEFSAPGPDLGATPLPQLCQPVALSGPVRLAITGPNGCGKTSLLRMLAKEAAPQAPDAQHTYHGHGIHAARALVPTAWLDQHASTLAPGQSVLQALQALDTPLTEGTLRSHLALLGLGASQVNTNVSDLSGGEKLKAALACALWRKEPAQLLLLDEPTNHLDLQSIEALEQALKDYTGALAVVSHDHSFLHALCPTHELRWTRSGWQLAER